MSELPVWARKPKHKKELVATERGWEVKETGELLRSTKFLKTRLEALVDEAKEAVESLSEAPEKDEPKQEVEATEAKAEGPAKDEQEPQKKKPGPKPGRKRGPKPKSKTE